MNDFGFYLVMTNPVVGYAKCAEAAVKAGVKIIQLRMKHASREEILREAREVRRGTSGTDTRLNGGDSPVELEKALSLSMDLTDQDWDLITLSGAWARERTIYRRPKSGRAIPIYG